jgi:hypothetical protein
VAKEDSKPYVISADLHGLMKRWSTKSGYSLPHESFFEGIRRDLEGVLRSYYSGNVEIVSEFELRSGLEKLAEKSQYPIVSLDRAYVDQNTPKIMYFLDLTRAVDEKMKDIGLYPRPGFPSKDEQMKYVCYGQGPITLLDDVVFSGGGIVDLAKEFEEKGRPVKQVIVGVGISEGVKKLRDMGIQVECVREYDDVVDEVCERDYYAGVPMSGRTVMASDGRIGSAPYFRPFGNPEKWATIPVERVPEFSRFCLTQSLVLWAAVSKNSQADIPVASLPRKIFGVSEDVSIITLLKEHVDNNKHLS